MKGFKIIRFYSNPSQNELNSISNLFSNEPEYYELGNSIFIFRFKVEDLLDNKKYIKGYIKSFYSLVMSNYKFCKIINNANSLKITRFNNINLKTYSNNNLSEILDKQLKTEFLQKQNYIDFMRLIEKNKIVVDDLSFVLDNEISITIDQYGTLYSNKINEVVKQICVYLLIGKIDE